MLSAITLLPQMEVSSRLLKGAEFGLNGSQPLHRAIINYLADDMKFAESDSLGKLPIDEEY